MSRPLARTKPDAEPLVRPGVLFAFVCHLVRHTTSGDLLYLSLASCRDVGATDAEIAALTLAVKQAREGAPFAPFYPEL
jgi:hypothetical protein